MGALLSMPECAEQPKVPAAPLLRPSADPVGIPPMPFLELEEPAVVELNDLSDIYLGSGDVVAGPLAAGEPILKLCAAMIERQNGPMTLPTPPAPPSLPLPPVLKPALAPCDLEGVPDFSLPPSAMDVELPSGCMREGNEGEARGGEADTEEDAFVLDGFSDTSDSEDHAGPESQGLARGRTSWRFSVSAAASNRSLEDFQFGSIAGNRLVCAKRLSSPSPPPGSLWMITSASSTRASTPLNLGEHVCTGGSLRRASSVTSTREPTPLNLGDMPSSGLIFEPALLGTIQSSNCSSAEPSMS
uniref:Uncharacterized protein n=1 Tax=Pyrodinium bahamense TaxID=73915 RepID=A0A7S0FIB3_9DINO|mmetsp:Transcript_34283/g.94667  ORF Transcript_34283/g.94667 Transcript_34283/m.94667 type:complete len:301 (+) Transcript_34283:130-1032(+)